MIKLGKIMHIRGKDIGLFLLVFFILLFSNDTLMFGANQNETFRYVGHIFIFLICLCLFIVEIILIFKYKRPINKIAIIVTTMILFVFIVDICALKDFALGNIVRVCLIMVALLCVCLFEFKVFMKAYSNVLIFLSSVSCFAFIVCLFKLDFWSFLPQISNLANYEFYSAGIFNVQKISSVISLRNYSIFREPGVFQLFLTFAAVYEILINENPKLFRLLILILALITTISFMALVSLCILFVIFAIVGKKKYGKLTYVLSYVGAGSFIVLFVLMAKFGIKIAWFRSDANVSFVTRYSSIIANLKIFLSYPILGVGTTNYLDYYNNEILSLKGDGGLTETILLNFAMNGFLYGTIFFLSIIFMPNLFSKNIIIRILLLVLFVACFLSQSMIYNCFYYVISLFAIVEILKKYYKNKGENSKNENIMANKC